MKKETKKAVKSCLKSSTILSETAVLELARGRVGKFLPLEATGYACTTEQLLDVLLAVSAQKETIEQVCADLQIKVGAETIRGYFNQQLKVEHLDELQTTINAAFARECGRGGQRLFIGSGGRFSRARVITVRVSNQRVYGSVRRRKTGRRRCIEWQRYMSSKMDIG